MPVEIERPIFSEGQILGAEDLRRLLAYSREQDARHERYLHTWGIGEGLDVTEQSLTGDFALQPGFATDSSGAPIVVAEPVTLDGEQLKSEAVLTEADEGAYPVFIVRAERAAGSGPNLGRCSSSFTVRKLESFAVRFRRIVTGWEEQDTVGVGEGPHDRPQSERLVLVGFVHWSRQKQKIVGFERRNAEGIGPRYAGARADEVVARGGEFVIRSREPGQRDAPMIVVDHHNEQKTFVLGLDNGKGGINEIFGVDSKGNVHAKGDIAAGGSLKGTVKSGEVYVESGIAGDGMILPLPAGIRQEQVDGGQVVVHTTITPRINMAAAPSSDGANGVYLPLVVECSVDEIRRIRCTMRWFKLDSTDPLDLPGIVDYLVVASVAKEQST